LPFPYIFLFASDCKCVWSCLSIEVVRWWSTYWIDILLAGEGFSSSSETGKNAWCIKFYTSGFHILVSCPFTVNAEITQISDKFRSSAFENSKLVSFLLAI